MTMIEQLRAEHADIHRILGVVERELATAERGDDADYELLRDAMHYMTQYPDLFHHVREDLVYRRLVRRDRSATGLVRALAREHGDLRLLGLEFLDAVEDVIDGAFVARDVLVNLGHAYVTTQRRHMEREDVEVFPRLEQSLTQGDWAECEGLIERAAGKGLNAHARERFRTLRDYIGP